MRITLISVVLVATAATVVTAAPRKTETAQRVSYNAQANQRGDWIELASPTPAKHAREYITVDGKYAQLRLAAHEGQPVIDSVEIVFADGKQRVVRIWRALGGKRPTAVFAVDANKTIDHVVVTTDKRKGGSYTVSGIPAGATGVASR